MNKAVLAGCVLGGGALAFLLYKMYMNPTQNYQTTSLNPGSSPNFTTDPYQSYPFVANQPARVDNSNQPWANNNRPAIGAVSNPQIDVNMSNLNMIAQGTKSLADIFSSTQSIWNDLGMSDWFSDGDVSAQMTDWNYDSEWSFA